MIDAGLDKAWRDAVERMCAAGNLHREADQVYRRAGDADAAVRMRQLAWKIEESVSMEHRLRWMRMTLLQFKRPEFAVEITNCV